MSSDFHELSAHELRILVIQEIKKFIFAIDRGVPIKELEDIQYFIRFLYSILDTKEKQEITRIYGDYFLQKNISLEKEIPPNEEIQPEPSTAPDEDVTPEKN